MQHSILNRTSNLNVLQNLDCLSLRSRIIEIQEELHNKMFKNERFLIGKSSKDFEIKSPLLSTSRNFRDISDENERMRLFLKT